MSNATSSEVLDAVIIGCGRIGGGDKTFSHAAAYTGSPNFRLTACVESNDEQRAQFMKKWNVPKGYASLDELLNSRTKFDVASICTPTVAHAQALEVILQTNVRAVFCEKPLTGDIISARSLADRYETAGILLAVNFHRRWDTQIQDLKRSIENGEWGAVQSISAHYMKGIYNNASHMLDLIAYLIGPLTPIAVAKHLEGFSPSDPTIDGMLMGPNEIIVHLAGLATDPYFMFELTIITEQGAIDIEDAGFNLRLRRVQDDPQFKGERNLSAGEVVACKQDQAFTNAVDNVHLAVTKGTPLASDAHSALVTQELCTNLAGMPPFVKS